MRVSKKLLGYVALAVVVLIAFIFLALPPLVKHVSVQQIDKSTGRKSQIAKVSLNPFTLTAEVSGFTLSEKGSSAPFLTFSSARLKLSPLSLPKRSFIVNEMHLASPYLHLVRSAPNKYNFSDLLVEKPGKKKQGSYLFSLNNIIINNGSIDFDDKALSKEKDHKIRDMKIAVPFVSNMPYLADRYVTPHFSALVNDSPFRFDGRLKPLTRAVEATLSLNLKRIDLPFYLGYLPSPLSVQIVSGRLSTALELGYRVDQKAGPEARLSGDLVMEKLAAKEHDGAPLLSLEQAAVKLREVSLLSRRVDLQSLALQGVELFVTKDRSGSWNVLRVAHGGEQAKAKQPPQEKNPPAKEEKQPAKEENQPQAKKPLDLKLAQFSLKDGKVHLSDLTPPGGFNMVLQDIDVHLRDFSLASSVKAPFEVSFVSSKGEKATITGGFAPAPVVVDANVELKDLLLKEYYQYLRGSLTAPLTGKVTVSSRVSYDAKQGVLVEKGMLKGEGLAAPFGNGDGFRLKEAVVSGIKVDLTKSSAEVERVDLAGGNITISKEQDGELSAKRLFVVRKKQMASAREQRPTRGKKSVPQQGFSYRIQKVTANDLGLIFTDRSKEDAPRFSLNKIKFSATGITGPKQGAIPLTLAAGFGNRGSLRTGGSLAPVPLRFKGNVELHNIPLRDFDAYLPQDLKVFVADGALDTKLALNVEGGTGGLKGGFNGSLGVRSFYCQDTEYDEDLLKWERLQLERFNGTISPFTLAISDVSLSNFYARVIVEKDGTLNLQHLREEEPQAAPAAQAAPASKQQPAPVHTATGAAAGSESPAQPHPIRIDTVTMQGGTLAFSDRHLDSPFDTTFYNLGGRVSALSSQANQLADVDLRGNLENHSPLSINGKINPLRGDLYLDLKIAFNDIELSPLTPYSNTYLGYDVDKGKLFLNLSYKIDKKALSSENKVFIDQFTFGKQVDSPKATKLPVRLAIALLKDKKGEIHLDLPVAGRTDDPKFSVWHVVLQILKNLLVKAATSPMALLGSMFGGGQDFSAVVFAPGSESFSKPEQEKLTKLAQVLHDRPALAVELTGYVDRERDAEGYRNELLMKKMKGEKFRKQVKEGTARPGQTPQDTEILPQEYGRYLKEVYVKEKFPKPRNALGFLKDLPDAEMKKLVVTNTVVGKNELQSLAHDRTGAVKTFLTGEGKIPPERLFEKSGDIYKAPAKEGLPGSRVEFGVSAK